MCYGKYKIKSKEENVYIKIKFSNDLLREIGTEIVPNSGTKKMSNEIIRHFLLSF